MEILIGGIIGGILLALVTFKVLHSIVGPAVDSLISWAIMTFGNDDALARHTREKESPKPPANEK